MIAARQLLPLLVGVAIGVGGWMLGHSGPGKMSPSGVDADERLRMAEEELAMLTKENESLRSLAQGGGEVAVPPEMIAQVEKDYGLKFISSPMFHRIAAEELGYRIEAAMESRLGPQGMDDREEAYRRIGWLRPEDDLLDQLVAVKSVGARGWFDEQTGEAWVTDTFEIKNIPDQAAMLRLLVRQLLNQHFPDAPAYPGDDEARAREALHAGAASGAEARFYAANARGIGFLPMNDNSAAARLLLVLSEFIQGLTIFPAVEGKNLADTAYVKGVEPFHELFRNPPTSTYRVVLPGEAERGDMPEFSEVTDEIYLKESAGYLGLRLWISETGDVGLAEELARELASDGYVLFADGAASSAVRWKVAFTDREAADKFEDIALSRIAAMAKKNTAPASGEVVSTEDGRFLRVFRVDPITVEYVNAATEESAAK